MWKAVLCATFAASAAIPAIAQASTFEQGMNTMWEVLWHQSGAPTRLVRWEQDLKVRVHGEGAAAHRQQAVRALRDTAAHAGLKLVDVTDAPDAATQANVTVEIGDAGLSDEQPCETRLQFAEETAIQRATLQMRARDAARCAYHEAMHVMGVRGHPEGETVLSYFTRSVDRLQPLDKAMLRAWYSPRARGGMTPFEVLPILADELAAVMPDRQRALQDRDRFLARTVEQMQAFADGRGDVPTIVKRSGKSSEAGIRYGRMEMSFFLGIAYLEGTCVQRDTERATHWLQRAVAMGSRPAQARLGAASGLAAGS
jgi:hypothetical protein